MGQSHGRHGSCCSGSCLLCLKAGNYLTVLGGCGCCILWPSPPQVSCPALPCRLPQWRGASVLAPARIHRGCVSALGHLLGKVPSRSHAVHPPYTHFWAGEGTGTASDSGRAPGGLRNIPGSQAKIAEEEQTFPFSLEPINKTPLATSTALGAEGQRRGHLLSSPLLSSHKAPSPVPQSEQELIDPSGHGAAPRHPPTSQPPHRKETKKSWRGLIDLSTEDTSFGLITPFCPVTNILKTYKKKNKLHPSYTKRHV